MNKVYPVSGPNARTVLGIRSDVVGRFMGRLDAPRLAWSPRLIWPTLDQQTMQMRPGWQILSQVEQLFDVVPIAESDTELPEGLDLL